MKTYSIIVILSCIAATSFAQRVQSSCDAPDSIKKKYREDAAWLAYQYEQNTNSPYLDSVIIPQDLQDRFMNALLAVYNVVGLPEADTVSKFKFKRNNGEKPSVISSFHDYPLNKMSLSLDTTILWQNRFIKGLKPTGNFGLDNIIEQYGIIFDTLYYNIYGSAAFTKERYNMVVLDSLMKKAGLIASVDWICCDGDKIEGEIGKDNSVQLIYSVYWGDNLVAGSNSERAFWQFRVFPDCSVEFDTSYGYSWQKYKVNYHFQSLKNDLILYPNPASGPLTIETSSQSAIEIIDLKGKVLQNVLSSEDKTEIDISSLPNGTYFIRATDKNGKKSNAKFIKE